MNLEGPSARQSQQSLQEVLPRKPEPEPARRRLSREKTKKLQTGEVADYRVTSQSTITKAAASFYLRQCCLPAAKAYRLHPASRLPSCLPARISTFPFPARLAICLLSFTSLSSHILHRIPLSSLSVRFHIIYLPTTHHFYSINRHHADLRQDPHWKDHHP
jgi:hypothetical protein